MTCEIDLLSTPEAAFRDVEIGDSDDSDDTDDAGSDTDSKDTDSKDTDSKDTRSKDELHTGASNTGIYKDVDDDDERTGKEEDIKYQKTIDMLYEELDRIRKRVGLPGLGSVSSDQIHEEKMTLVLEGRKTRSNNEKTDDVTKEEEKEEEEVFYVCSNPKCDKDIDLLQCKNCGAYYCSKECIEHCWKYEGHRSTCRKINDVYLANFRAATKFIHGRDSAYSSSDTDTDIEYKWQETGGMKTRARTLLLSIFHPYRYRGKDRWMGTTTTGLFIQPTGDPTEDLRLCSNMLGTPVFSAFWDIDGGLKSGRNPAEWDSDFLNISNADNVFESVDGFLVETGQIIGKPAATYFTKSFFS